MAPPTALLEQILRADSRLERVKLHGSGVQPFMPPTGPILAGYYLEPSSTGDRHIWWTLIPLYTPPPFHVSFTFGERLLQARGEPLEHELERTAPFLEHARTLESFADWVTTLLVQNVEVYRLRALALTQLRLGRLEHGLRNLERLADRLDDDPAWQANMKRLARNLVERGRGTDGLGALQRLIDSWEVENRKTMRLSSPTTPTPSS